MLAIDPQHLIPSGPIRTCVGCRTRRPANELVRLTWRARIVVDGPSDGRGAWLCRADAMRCLEEALQHRRLDRAWRTRLNPEDHNKIRRALKLTTITMDLA